jgi:cyclopropane-fatty-acyl-phospholipid synthase
VREHGGRGETVAQRVDAFVRRVGNGALGRRPFAVRFWDASVLPANDPAEPRPVTLVVRHPGALVHALREPNQLGLGRAWVSGALDLEGDVEDALRQLDAFAGLRLSPQDRLLLLARAWRLLGRRLLDTPPIPGSEARIAGRRHSQARDRVAVRHHYDVPADFYRLVLGETMVYSCAYFASPDEPLDDAQRRKLDVICCKLRLRPGDRLLDVGCGWGSLVVHAAQRFGVQAVGVTLSEHQAAVARRRIREAGLSDRCEVRVADYRAVDDGPYDAIASVGMYEHVGRAQLPTYVAVARSLLREGGLFLNHGITRLGPPPSSRKRFIDAYVFPDGELHPLADVVGALERGGLEVRDVESLREHYAMTLRAWLRNLAEHRAEAVRIAGAERERIWRLYMAGSARAFARQGDISIVQVLALRPGAGHRLPLERARLLEPGVIRQAIISA